MGFATTGQKTHSWRYRWYKEGPRSLGRKHPVGDTAGKEEDSRSLGGTLPRDDTADIKEYSRSLGRTHPGGDTAGIKGGALTKQNAPTWRYGWYKRGIAGQNASRWCYAWLKGRRAH